MGDANTVEMRIQVVDGGSGAVINKVTTELTGLDAAAAKTGASMGAAGAQTEVAGAQMATGAQAGTAGMNGLRNSAMLARFELQELGVHAPRYLSTIAAQSTALMGVMSALSGVFIGLGVISIFGMAIKEAKEFYHAHLDVNAAMDDYLKKAGESAQKELFDNASIETTAASLRDINAQLSQIESHRAAAAMQGVQAANAPDAFLMGSKGTGKDPQAAQDVGTGNMPKPFDAVAAGREEAALSTSRDLMYNRNLDQKDELTRQRIESDREYFDATHKGYAKIAGDKKYDIQLSDLELQATKRKEQEAHDTAQIARNQQIAQGITADKLIYVPPVDQTAGDTEAAERKRAIGLKASGAAAEQSRTEEDELTRMQDEAVNAGLRGNALYTAQREQSIDEIRTKVEEGEISERTAAAETAAVREKFANETLKRLEDQREETVKLHAQAAMTGLTGAGRIQAEGGDHERQAGLEAYKSGLDFSQMWSRVRDIETATTADMTKDEQEFFERVNALSDSSADHQGGAYARIRAQAKRELDQLQKDFNEHTNGLQDPTAYASYYGAYQRGQSAVGNSSAEQLRTLNQQNDDQTRKLEDEANRKSMRPEQQKTQQIVDEYNERLRSYQKEKDQELQSTQVTADDKLAIEENYNRRVLAANKEMNAELAQNSKEQQDKLAGQLEGLFKKPQDYFKNLGTHMMAESAAAILMRAKGEMGLGGPQSAGDSTHTMGGGILGSILGGDWLRGRQGASSLPGASHTASTAAAHMASLSTLSITSASISVQSATISGIGGAAGSSPRGAFSAPSSTVGLSGASGSTASGTGADIAGFGDSMIYGGGLGASSGSGSGAGSSVASMAGSAGASMPGHTASGVLGDVSSTIGLYNQVKSTFSGAQGAPGADGTFKPTQASVDGGYSSSDSTKLPTGPTAAQGMQAFQGAMGLYGAAMSTGGFGGAAGGAMSGMELGMVVGGPIGAAVGAAAGALLGVMGFGGRMQAANYWNKQIKPQMDQTDQAFATGSMDYLSAWNAINSLESQAQKDTSKMGPSAGAYYGDTIKPALDREMAMFSREARAGRQQFSMSSTQFHSGGVIDDFGDLATSSNEGFIHAMKGEIVMRNGQNPPSLSSSSTDMREPLPSKMQPMKQTEVNLHFHSPDAKGARQLIMDNKHHIRAAINSSYSEYSGGSDAGF